MKYTIDRQENYMIFAVHEARINSDLSPNLKSEILIQHAKGICNFILDLSEVKYIDSSGLSALLVGDRVFKEKKGNFVLVGLSDHVMKLMKMSRLDSMFHILPTTVEAIDAIRQHIAKHDDGDAPSV